MFIFIKRFIMITIEGDNRFGPYHRNTESECKVDLSSPLNTHIHIYMNRILGNLVSPFILLILYLGFKMNPGYS